VKSPTVVHRDSKLLGLLADAGIGGNTRDGDATVITRIVGLTKQLDPAFAIVTPQRAERRFHRRRGGWLKLSPSVLAFGTARGAGRRGRCCTD
jgi:hypothetical protein